MPAPSDNVWMPSQGPHPVNIGSSLSKALKARKGTAAPAKRSNLPDREFYSFRYNFKPESIDPTKPGTIEVKKGKESTSVTVERASTQQGEGQLFQGNEQPAREWECVLIYDEETDTFTLEKLESYLVLNYDRKTVMQANRPSESPAPTASGSASPIKKSPPVDADRAKRAPSVQAMREEEEEASEPDTKPLPKPKAAPQPSRPTAASTSAPRPTPKPVNRPSLPQKPPTPVESPSASPVLSKQVKPNEKAKGKAVKRDRDEMEGKDVYKPPRPMKVSRPSPPPPAPAPAPSQPPSQGLALPTAPAAPSRPVFELPFGGGAPSLPVPPPKPASPPAPPPPKLSALTVISDSEDEWDEIPAEPAAPPATMTVTLAADEPTKTVRPDESDEEDFDMNAFAQQMDEHLGEDEDEDFLAAAVSPEPDPESEPRAPATGGPMSLNKYLGDANEDIFGDEDYSSSSDESDD